MIEVTFKNVCGTFAISKSCVSLAFDNSIAQSRKFIINNGEFANSDEILKERIKRLASARDNHRVKYECTFLAKGNLQLGCAVIEDSGERMSYIASGSDMFILAVGNLNNDIRSNVWEKVVNDRTIFVIFDVNYAPMEFSEQEYNKFSSRLNGLADEGERKDIVILWKTETKICFENGLISKRYLAEYPNEVALDYDALYELNRLD